MKKFISGLILFACSSIFTLNSCKKADAIMTNAPAVVVTGNVAAIQADPSLSLFSKIETKSGDDILFNSSISILAPVDSALLNAGINAAAISSLSVAACDSIVKYYASTNAVNFTNTETGFISILGPSFYADSSSTSKYFNGVATTSMSPTIVGASSIYKITQFINLPAVSLAQIISTDNNLTLLKEAINVTNLAPSLTGGSFTLLMPTNAAFAAAGFPDIASIDSANLNTLRQILSYHIVPNIYFENDIALQTTLTTLQGETLQVNNSNGLQLIGTSDPSTPAGFLNNGILAGNVLSYKINTVLLP